MFPYLGPAFVVYLVATSIAAGGTLDAVGALVALTAVALSSITLGRPRQARAADFQVRWLAFLAAVALVEFVAPDSRSLVTELSHPLAASAFGAVLIDQALRVPDRPPRLWLPQFVRHIIAAVAASVALLAVGALVAPPGWPIVFVSGLAQLPAAFSIAAVLLALTLRLSRRRLGSDPEALASNVWGVLGLVPASLLGVFVLLMPDGRLESPALRAATALCALTIVASHLKLIDPRQRLQLGASSRQVTAAAATLLFVSLSGVAFGSKMPPEPWALALGSGFAALMGLLLYRMLLPAADVLLAPAGGKLLEAIREATDELSFSHDVEGTCGVVLRAMRRAADTAYAEPVMYLFNPAKEVRLDAAGNVRFSARELSDVLLKPLRDAPYEFLLRDPLESQIVRQPPLRPLVERLVTLDALCVVPLSVDSELEGVLVIPRGSRRTTLTLEEIAALRDFAKFLSAFLSILSAQDRAQARAMGAERDLSRATSSLDVLRSQVNRLSADARVLAAGPILSEPPIAYSPAMRELAAQTQDAAETDAPVLFIGEGGLAIEPVARLLHRHSGRSSGPFVVGDCSSVASAQVGARLFGTPGGDAPQEPGWLQVAAGGTLLLLDLPALPLDTQAKLATVLRDRADVRMVASARGPLDALTEAGHFDPSLRELFVDFELRLPPLRQRPDDLPSLILLSLDRAARRLGRGAVGLEPDAQAALLAHDWPGNLIELEAVIEQAVGRCRSLRIRIDDLPNLQPGRAGQVVAGHPLEGSYETIERRVLEHALSRAGGNKTDAARLLGLKRSTFASKLRRYQIQMPAPVDEMPSELKH